MFGSGQAVATELEQVVDLAMAGEERLGLRWRLEPLPLPLASSGCGFRRSRPLFRSDAGHRSDMMSATAAASPQVMVDDPVRRWSGQAAGSGARLLRRLSPESSIRQALWTTRSRMASARVGSPTLS
jgi:hypothetical protein